MKLAAPRSPKFRRLMRAIGRDRIATIGTLEALWLFTMEQAPAGDVGRWEDEEIESELDWEGEPGALVEALVETGWVDRHPKYRLVIHDWKDHLPDFMKKRLDRSGVEPIDPRNEPDPPQGHESEKTSGEDTSSDGRRTDGGQTAPSGSRADACLGKPRVATPREAEGGAGGDPPSADTPAPRARARALWPRLRERAKRHGGRWSERPGPKQLECVEARLRAGASEEDLERAVEGYIRKHGTEPHSDFNPMAHFTATTVFRKSKFDAYVEASHIPKPKRVAGPQYHEEWKGYAQ